ncbi:hypothetical protein LR007_03480, partial [candidate division NPL-UPA2 bacterium]|nr:hypothetical protein [candidate division NPL-UPA2 bacterium]
HSLALIKVMRSEATNFLELTGDRFSSTDSLPAFGQYCFTVSTDFGSAFHILRDYIRFLKQCEEKI